MAKILAFFNDFFELFFPKLCMACTISLNSQEQILCTNCLIELPRTNYHLDQDNPVSMLFWGKVQLNAVTAFYYFTKGSKFQKLIHKLKYQGGKEIGHYLGKQMAYDILDSHLFNDVEIIVPVPLHPKKKKKRGYNQSDWIAFGIAEVYKKEADTKSLIRSIETETQTKKSRMERWRNVESIFTLRNPDKFKNKHILLVDDVITTGSTLEACIQELQQVDGIKISIATLAVAK